MEVIGTVREIKERLIPGKDGRQDWTKRIVVLEVANPLQFVEVQVTRQFEAQLERIRGCVGRQVVFPVYPPQQYGSRMEAVMSDMPRLYAVQAQPKAVNV